MVRTERKGHKKGQGASDDDTSKDGESVSKQGKNKKNGDEPEPFDARETVDSKMHGKPFMSSGIAQKPSRKPNTSGHNLQPYHKGFWPS